MQHQEQAKQNSAQLKQNNTTQSAYLETEAHIGHVAHLPTQQMQITIAAHDRIDGFPNLLQQHVFRGSKVLPLGEQDISR